MQGVAGMSNTAAIEKAISAARFHEMAAASGASLAAEPGRPLIVRVGKHLRGLFDRLIASSSQVANDAVLDVRDFPWTALLRDDWQAIRDEAIAVALRG